MSELKFATFGCWNERCKEGSSQRKVAELLKKNETNYKFLVLLGDNYYSEKIKIKIDNPDPTILDKIEIKYNDINLEEMKNGFNCLLNINLPKKMILGNHDIEEGENQGCSNMRSQLKLPWYDIKFPFDYENHFISFQDSVTNRKSYKMIKFIYLDTTIYSIDKDVDNCYNRVINKKPSEIIKDQETFIGEQLKGLNKEITNTVVFFGHEPLITYRFKKGKAIKQLPLLDIIYKLTENMHNDYQFNYVCADFHNFEEAYITKPYEGTGNIFKIHQLVFGTGGKEELDERFNPMGKDRMVPINGFQYDMYHRYASDEPKQGFESPPKHTNGYGEITINKDGLNYKFMAINPDQTKEWKQKYLSYKNKYLKLKNKLLY